LSRATRKAWKELEHKVVNKKMSYCRKDFKVNKEPEKYPTVYVKKGNGENYEGKNIHP